MWAHNYLPSPTLSTGSLGGGGGSSNLAIAAPLLPEQSYTSSSNPGNGLDILSWLQGPEEAQPPVEYLASIPISFPLIGLAQLVQYLVSTASRRGRSAHLYIASQVIPRALYPLSFLPRRRRKSRSFRTRLKLPSGFSTLVCTGRKLFLSSRLNRASHKMLLKAVRVTRRRPCLPSRASRVLPSSTTLPRPTLNCSSDCKTMQMSP